MQHEIKQRQFNEKNSNIMAPREFTYLIKQQYNKTR